LRIKAKLSQEAFADEAGIDRSYIGGIERGEHNVALINLLKIASALGISLAQLAHKAKL
jgi:transcriptional regulator with XRE-family HTH domain